MVKSKRAIRIERERGSRRGHRRRLANGLELEFFAGPAVSPEIRMASQADVLAALERFDPGLDWASARPLVRPMLPRLRPFPAAAPDQVAMLVPPGILIGFALDLGPAFAYVGDRQLRHWGIDRSILLAAALDNIRRLASSCDPRAVVTPMDGLGAVALLSRVGIGSSLLLVPELMERFFGQGPHLLIAPMRDLMVALPPDTDRPYARWLANEFEAIDPNCLHLGLFRYERGSIEAEVDVERLPVA